ncbi:hypothetical protein ACLK11_01880 [Escherichia coli]
MDKFKIDLARQFPTRQQQRILEVSLDRTRLEQCRSMSISTCTSFKQTAEGVSSTGERYVFLAEFYQH